MAPKSRAPARVLGATHTGPRGGRYRVVNGRKVYTQD